MMHHVAVRQKSCDVLQEPNAVYVFLRLVELKLR